MLKANIEKDNYDRINKLLQVAATPAVKQKFDTEFDPSILKSTLNKSYCGLGKLKNRESSTSISGLCYSLKMVRKDASIKSKNGLLLHSGSRVRQWGYFWFISTRKRCPTLKIRIRAAPSSSDFDLTLMICLLKNFTEMDKSDIFPMETDTSDAACLLRLKHYRNNIVHSRTFALSNEDFKQYWEHITCAVCKLGGESYREMCLQLKCSQLDENENKYEKDCDKCTRTRQRRKLDITHREIFSYNGCK